MTATILFYTPPSRSTGSVEGKAAIRGDLSMSSSLVTSYLILARFRVCTIFQSCDGQGI